MKLEFIYGYLQYPIMRCHNMHPINYIVDMFSLAIKCPTCNSDRGHGCDIPNNKSWEVHDSRTLKVRFHILELYNSSIIRKKFIMTLNNFYIDKILAINVSCDFCNAQIGEVCKTNHDRPHICRTVNSEEFLKEHYMMSRLKF